MVNLLLAVCSGLLLWAGFAPLEFWFAPFIGVALLFHLLCEKNFRQRVFFVLIVGFSFFAPLLHWSSIYVGSSPWLVLVLGESAIFLLIALFSWSKRWESALSFALLFTLIELIRMKFPFGGFGWGRLGFTQIDSLAYLYSFVGVTGISLVVAVSSLLAISIRANLAILLPVFAFSFLFANMDDDRNSFQTFQVTAIQGGVDTLGLDFNNRALRVLERHAQATKIIPGTDVYIWPENAADVDPLKNKRANVLIKKVISEIDAPLLIGAVEESSEGPYNSSLLFGSDAELESRYIKQDLAPYGEYMPMRKLAEAISPYARNVNDFVAGDIWKKHFVEGIPFQSLICFEVLDDDHAKNGAMGTAFLVAQTNNATFGRSSEAAQQLQITRARAAETGRNFAVVSTTGFTAHINSHGKIVQLAEQYSPQALTMKIGLEEATKVTWAQRLSSGIWALILLLGLGISRMKLNR